MGPFRGRKHGRQFVAFSGEARRRHRRFLAAMDSSKQVSCLSERHDQKVCARMVNEL
jgi:hypothetical protein